ncbi:MAG: hypothetical protein WBE48_08230 [Xanthobacteraceae bacterium]
MLRPHETGIDRTIEPHDFGIMADRRKLIGVLPGTVEARRCCARHQHGKNRNEDQKQPKAIHDLPANPVSF